MKSTTIIKSRSPKSNISNMGGGRAKNYLNKNLHKKYIYKKEKAIDTDKVLQNNKISKNLVFSPTYKKGNNGIKYKNILNNSNSDLRRGIEIRDDVNIDYEQYQQQINNVTISNYNPIINNSNMMNQSFFVMSKKNGYLTNSNNKWKCSKCGNVNSNFNFLCNNCNMPNNSLDQNSSLIVNQRSGSTGKTIEAIGLDNNLINSSFNNSFNNNSFNNNSFNNNSFNNNINNSSQNLLSKSINNSVIKKQFLRKNNTTNNLLSPYYSNIDYNSIRNKNKNNNNFFYSGGNKTNDNQNDIINSNNAFETERDNNITHLYSYSNYLLKELKSSNDTNTQLLENYENNENEYNSNYQQNDSIKKKIKSLREKENQLEKVNEQLQASLSYIKEKINDKNVEDQDGGMIRAIFNDSDFDLSEFKSKMKELTEENEKLSDKLKGNKDIIIKLKTRIGELSDDKKVKNLDINNNKKKQNTALIKDKINQYIGDIKEQNQEYNKLDNENRIMEQKIKLLKKQLEDEEKNNIINKSISMNENNKYKTINSVPINNNNDAQMETDKDIYLKTKEKNNKLAQFVEELNKVKDNKNNKNKINTYNMDEKYLMEMLNVDGENNNEEKEIMDFISDYLNLLNERTD